MVDSTLRRGPLSLGITALSLCVPLLTGLPVALAAPTVVATIAVGGYPIDVGVNATTNRIYVANTTGNLVAVVDGSTNAVITTIAVGNAPYGVDVNPTTNMIYTANKGSDNVSVIDGASNTVSATVAVGVDPAAVAVNSVTNKIYVVNQTGDSVSVINGATNAVTATISVGDRPGGVAVNSTTNRIYVANANSNTVSVINGATDAVIATVAVGDGSEGIDVNSVTNRIYVANQWAYTVSVIDGATNTVTATVTLPNMNNQGVGVNPATNRVYVSSFYNGKVNVIDGATNAVTAHLNVGSGPWGVGVNPATSRIYVGNSNGGSVSVLYDPFTITASAGTGGSISPSGSVGVNPGADQAFTISPSTGYHVTDVFADGGFQGTVASYTFSNVDTDHTISAHFAVDTFQVSASVSGGHGSAQGAQTVNYDDSASVSFTPDAGYYVASITDNGVPKTVSNPYLIDNVVVNHNVVVTFALNSYAVNASVFYTGHGSVSPDTQTIDYDAPASVDLIPDAGCHASFLMDNGSPVAVSDPYVIDHVQATHHVIAFFAINEYTVAAISGANGTVGGQSLVTQTVAHGDDADPLTAVPDPGYHFTGWTGDYVGTDNPLNLTNVTGSMTVTANFAINEYRVEFMTDGTEGATLTGDLVQTIAHGGVTTMVTAVAPDAHEFVSWSGGYTGAANPLTVMVTSNMTIVANFQVDQVACGSVFEVAAADIEGLPIGGVFRFKPKVYATCTLNGKPGKALAKVLTKIDKLAGNTTLSCEWTKKLRLYDATSFKGSEAGGIGAAGWITATTMHDLVMDLHLVSKEAADQSVQPLALAVPVIANIADGGKDAKGNDTLVITGQWFGTKKPKVWREYTWWGKIRHQAMKVVKPTTDNTDYLDSKLKPACMDPATGESKVIVIVPTKQPNGVLNGTIVLDNGVGLAVGGVPVGD